MLHEGAQHVPVSLGFTGGSPLSYVPQRSRPGWFPAQPGPPLASVRNKGALMLKYGTGKGDENVLLFFLMHPEEDPQ